MDDEPELYIVDPSAWPGAAEWREKHERQKATARARYLELVAAEFEVLGASEDPARSAASLFDLLFVHRHDDGHECACGCHPRLPSSDLHDFGFACPCGLTPEERRARFDEWRAGMDAYWESPEGRTETARHEAEEAELAAWIADHPGVEVTSHGGFAPEQWSGTVDGHRFYFRERHDQWRIELDLRPSGRFANALVGTDDDGAMVTEPRELEEGDVIAEGTTGDALHGQTPTERAGFIVAVIRDHLRRAACIVHTLGREDLVRRLGGEATFCPTCGTRLDAAQPK